YCRKVQTHGWPKILPDRIYRNRDSARCKPSRILRCTTRWRDYFLASHLLALAQTDQRSWDLAIVADCADGLVLSDVDKDRADVQGHVCWSGLDRRRCGRRGHWHVHRILRRGKGWEHQTTSSQSASEQKPPSRQTIVFVLFHCP